MLLRSICFSSGLLSFLAALFLASRHASAIIWGRGKGCSLVYLCKYVLSISAVRCFSLKLRPLCPLFPAAVIIPCSVSMSLRLMSYSSAPSNPVSANIVKVVAVFMVAAAIIASTFCFVGMIGIFASQWYVGLFHWMSLVLQKYS